MLKAAVAAVTADITSLIPLRHLKSHSEAVTAEFQVGASVKTSIFVASLSLHIESALSSVPASLPQNVSPEYAIPQHRPSAQLPSAPASASLSQAASSGSSLRLTDSILQHATLAPALPVVKESGYPPKPRSSSSA